VAVRDAAARGARLALLGWGVSQGLTFAAYIVLAHLVSPGIFGSFAAGTVLIGTGVLFAESGVTAALIGRRDGIDAAASTAFFRLLAGGAVVALLALAASPLVGLFFRDAQAGAAAAALSGWLLLRAITIVPDALLQRRGSYARRVAVDPLGAVMFAGVSIGACAAGAGIWGLVAGTYASEVAEVVAALGFARFRPSLRLASRAVWRELSAVARPVLGSEILRRVASQADVIMLGRFAGAGTLGQYRNGYRLASQPGNAFVDVAAYVLLPSLARISGDAARLRLAVMRAYDLALMAAIPVSLAAVPLGVPVAVLFLGDRWRAAGHAVAALWGLFIGGALTSIAAESAKAIGRPGLLVRIHGVSLALTVTLVCAAVVPFGLVGVASALSISQVAVGLFAFAAIAPSLGMGFGYLAHRATAPLLAAGAMMGAMLAFSAAVSPLGQGELRGLLLTGAQALLGAVVYLALLATIDSGRRNDLRVVAHNLRAVAHRMRLAAVSR
jgi:O-antigen/teichoic acid export membrane protein